MQAYVFSSEKPTFMLYLEHIIQPFLFLGLLLFPQKSVKKDHHIRGQIVLLGRKFLFHKAQRNLLVMSLVF